jgi:hypothetical protein
MLDRKGSSGFLQPAAVMIAFVKLEAHKAGDTASYFGDGFVNDAGARRVTVR